MKPGSLEVLGRRLCLSAAAIGAFGLGGWQVGLGEVTGVLPGQPPMMPSSALCLVLLGIAGAASRSGSAIFWRRLAVVAAALATALGLATIVEYTTAVDLNIDELLTPAQFEPSPDRMSPPSAIAFGLLGAAVLIFDARPAGRVRPSEWLVLCAGLIGLVAVIAQALGAGRVYRFEGRFEGLHVVALAAPTALAIVFVAMGLLFARPNAGVMKVATSAGPGGVLLRRLAAAALVGPLVLGVLLIRLLEVLGIGQVPLVYATLTVSVTMVGFGLLVATTTPLDRMHEALEAGQARTQELFEQASEGIFVADRDGRYTAVNGAGHAMLGYDRGELVGKLVDELITDAERARFADEKARLLVGETSLGDWMLRRKDGSIVEAEVSAVIHPDGRWQAFVRDVSERKRTECAKELLSELGALLGSTLEDEVTLARVASLLVRHRTDHCVIDVIGSAGRARRVTATQGDPTPTTSDAPDRAPPEEIRTALASRRPELVERISAEASAWLGLDAAPHGLQGGAAPRPLVVVPLLAHDEPMGTIYLVPTTSRTLEVRDLRLAREIADRTALWLENVRLYAATQRALKDRDDMLGVVAHDLRNPLGAVLLQVSLLRRLLERDGHPLKPAAVIERAAKRMNRLIEDLLDIARMEAGSLSVERVRRASRQLVADAVEAQSPLVASASLELELDLQADLPDVAADRDRVLQVFENLIGNAVKFVSPGGRITVGAASREHEVLFWVADNGNGIGPEALPHLFERFWQAEKTGRRGAGLGLPIVKGIVEAHGGRVWAESTVGRGSTFFFTLPSGISAASSHELALATG